MNRPTSLLALGLAFSLGACSIPSAPQNSISQTVPSTEPPSNIEALTNFPHQRLTFSDPVQPGSDFAQFREKVRQAVRDRQSSVIQELIPAQGIAVGFSVPRSAAELELQNPAAPIWTILEKAVLPPGEGTNRPGCESVSPRDLGVTATETWVCSNVTSTFYKQYPKPADSMGISYEMSRVIVVGEEVSVHEKADRSSPIVGLLSNEMVRFDEQVWEQLSIDDRVMQMQLLEGWMPVRLPNDRAGYVQNRFAYRPLDARVVFGKVSGQWQILHIPSGD